MVYHSDLKTCPDGCDKQFRESLDDHRFTYHQEKRIALVCGCGFGDIFVDRFRKHMQEVHDMKMSKDHCVARYLWHNLPPFRTIKTCSGYIRDGKCRFRSPSDVVMNRHRCARDAKLHVEPSRTSWTKDTTFREGELPKQGHPPQAIKGDVLIIPALPKKRLHPSDHHSESPKRQRRDETTRDRRTTSQRASEREQESSESESEDDISEHSGDNRTKEERHQDDIDRLEEVEEMDDNPELSDGEIEDPRPTRSEEQRISFKVVIPNDHIVQNPPEVASKSSYSDAVQIQKSKNTQNTQIKKPLLATPPGLPPPKRKPFEPNYDVLEQLAIPNFHQNISTYKHMRDQVQWPENTSFYGVVQYCNVAKVKVHSDLMFFSDQYLRLGKFVVTDFSGMHSAYVTVTLYERQANRIYDENRLYAQFNPINAPVYIRVIDAETAPQVLRFYLAMSMPLPVGEYRLVSVPAKRSDRVVKFWIKEAKNYGQRRSASYPPAPKRQ